MQQAVKIDGYNGAGSDHICDSPALAVSAWGKKCQSKNSGLLALGYLTRRFGPSFFGGDNHKSLVEYYLTTADPEVILWLHLSAGSLHYNVGYLAKTKLRSSFHKPQHDWENEFTAWWYKKNGYTSKTNMTDELSDKYWEDRLNASLMKKAEKAIGAYPLPSMKSWRFWDKDSCKYRINKAIYDALKELLVPVFVRDVPINIFGRCESYQRDDKSVECSKYAGFGIPKKALDRLVKSSK